MVPSPEQELKYWLQSEEQKISSLLHHERRLNLIEMVRAMDYLFIGNQSEFFSQTERLNKVIQSFNYGMNKVLALTLDNSSRLLGAPLFRSTKQSQNLASSFIQYCGRLSYCENMLELCRLQILKLKRLDPHSYLVTLNPPNHGMEYFETENFLWRYKYLIRSQQSQIAKLREQEEYVWSLMLELVAPWEKYYIQYEARPEIDTFYEQIGIINAQTMFGYDSFPGHVEFGEIQFDAYCAVLTILVGWAMKHLGFCFQLFKKRPELYSSNVFTITMPFESVVREIQAATTLPAKACKQILNRLTLTTENIDTHCFPPSNLTAPPFIQIGQGQLLRPIWGNLSNPFAFLLRELRSVYRKDWDKAVILREEAFRNDLYALFSPDRFTTIRRNIQLKKDGELLTDIDALIFDRITGTVGIFQLKWQDPFANNMRERESRKSNFLHTGNKWIASVSLWLKNNTSKEISMILRLDNQTSEPPNKFRLFMLGRNFSHFSGESNPDQRAAWGFWYQVVRLMFETVNLDDPLNSLYNQLKADSPLKKDTPEFGQEVIDLNGITVTFDPETS